MRFPFLHNFPIFSLGTRSVRRTAVGLRRIESREYTVGDSIEERSLRELRARARQTRRLIALAQYERATTGFYRGRVCVI